MNTKSTYEQRDEREVNFKTVTMPAIAKALDTGKISGNIESKWCESVKLAGSEKGFFFRYDSHQHRIGISGVYPKSRLVGETSREFAPRDYCRADVRDLVLSIGVSADKSAEQIVADMRRRLIPNYYLAFAACEARRNEHEDHVCKVNRFAQRLANALATSVFSSPNRNEPLQNKVKLPRFGYAPMEVMGDSVNVRLDLSHENALKLAHFLNTL